MLDPKKFRRNLIHSPSSRMLCISSDSYLFDTKKWETNSFHKIILNN